MMEGRAKLNFDIFKKKIKQMRAPITDNSFTRYGNYRKSPVKNEFTTEEIIDIIKSGDADGLVELSKYYYRTNGVYHNNVEMLATMSKFQTVLTPVYDINKKRDNKKITNLFYKGCDFIESLNVPVTFCNITRKILIGGKYFGILRDQGDSILIQDLPSPYCRTRFKDYNGLNILEFNLRYFDSITDEEFKKEALKTFPVEVQRAYSKKTKGKLADYWIDIPPSIGGACFTYGDGTPYMVSSIISLQKMEDSIDREAQRDENELYKILVQKMPIDNKGELVFQLEEVADIHEATAEMLKNNDTINVLTTFGDVKLESVQDSSSASQSADRIEKYKTAAYDALGRSSILFNANGNASLAYSIQKDEGFIRALNEIYSAWIKFQVNQKYATSSCSFDFTILETTTFNQKDIQSQFFQAAQYGYSKMVAGVAIGIKQKDQLSLMSFENDILEMSAKMIPLQSSYTTSGADIKKEEKSEEKQTNNNTPQDLNDSGGRPELDDTAKTDKTEQNVNSAS